MRTPAALRLAALALTATAFAACASDDPVDDSVEGDIPRQCEDGIDNDENGLTDCDDPTCADAPLCSGGGGGGGTDAGMDTGLDGGGDTGGDTGGEDAGEDADHDTTEDVGGDTTADAGEDVIEDAGEDATEDTGGPDVGPDGPPTRDCMTTLTFTPAPGTSTVSIGGPFNGWTEGVDNLTDDDGDGTWEITLELPPGEQPYKFITDGVWDFEGNFAVPDWITVDFYTQWVDGFENRNVIVGDCTVPAMETVRASGGPDGVTGTFRFWRANDGAALDESSVVVTAGGDPVPFDFDAETGLLEVDVAGLDDGKYSIRITAEDTDGRSIETTPHFVPLWVEDEPFLWRDATMYFVFTDRFRNSDAGEDIPQNAPIEGVPWIANYQGGDFRGVIQAIEEGYFDDLGVNLLWLSPITENPEGNWLAADRFHEFSGFHGYWPTSAVQIEFRWGDIEGTGEERLLELIDAAHARGIRVLFDIALNHVHLDHDYRRDHPEWFTADVCNCTTDPGPCNWDTNPLFCWFIDYLPDLDYRQHGLVEQVSRDVEYLVTHFDVDAFRIDAAKHMHHVIMRRVALRMQDRFEAGGGAEVYLVGETFTGGGGHGLIMDYVNPWELDAQYDFPLLYPIRDSFVFSGSFRNLSAARQTSEDAYGDHYFEMSPFLGNHDIPRTAQLITDNGGGIDPWAGVPDPMDAGFNDTTWNIVNRMSMGLAYVFTNPGIPLLYYGDEIGLYGGADPDNRRPMVWGDDLSAPQRELLSRVQAIGQARQDHRALRRGVYRELWVDDDFYVYARDAGDGDVVIVAMNKGEGRAQPMGIPADLGIDGTTFTDVLAPDSPRSFTVRDDGATITLNPWEYAIFAP